jgi:HK97 family phage portal protein
LTQGFGGMFNTPPLWSDGERHGTDLDGRLVSFESIYRSQPVVAAVIDKLSRRIATLPFAGYSFRDDQARDPLPRDHDLATLIRSPIPGWATVHLLQHIYQSLLLHGNAMVAKLRDPSGDREDPPFMLWPLDWAQTNAYGSVGGRIEWWSTTEFDNEERFMAAADVIHFAWPGPGSSQIGVSPLEKLGVTIKIDDAAQRHQVASFRNGNRPSLAVSLGGSPKQETIDRAREALNAMHKGPDNAAKTLFLTGEAKVDTLSLSPVEVALIEQRHLAWEEVGMVYDMGGPLMNDFRRATFANVTELLKALYRDVIPPWTTLGEQTLQAQLIDPEPAWADHFLAFDFSEKLKGEPLALAQTLALQVNNGLITRNEARRILNMPPEGDPADKTNPANQLTTSVNNQGTLEQMGGNLNAPASTEPSNTGGTVPAPTQ